MYSEACAIYSLNMRLLHLSYGEDISVTMTSQQPVNRNRCVAGASVTSIHGLLLRIRFLNAVDHVVPHVEIQLSSLGDHQRVQDHNWNVVRLEACLSKRLPR